MVVILILKKTGVKNAIKKSKSKKAFGENVKAEMAAGKPKKKAVAIAYSVKRKAKMPKRKK